MSEAGDEPLTFRVRGDWTEFDAQAAAREARGQAGMTFGSEPGGSGRIGTSMGVDRLANSMDRLTAAITRSGSTYTLDTNAGRWRGSSGQFVAASDARYSALSAADFPLAPYVAAMSSGGLSNAQYAAAAVGGGGGGMFLPLPGGGGGRGGAGGGGRFLPPPPPMGGGNEDFFEGEVISTFSTWTGPAQRMLPGPGGTGVRRPPPPWHGNRGGGMGGGFPPWWGMGRPPAGGAGRGGSGGLGIGMSGVYSVMFGLWEAGQISMAQGRERAEMAQATTMVEYLEASQRGMQSQFSGVIGGGLGFLADLAELGPASITNQSMGTIALLNSQKERRASRIALTAAGSAAVVPTQGIYQFESARRTVAGEFSVKEDAFNQSIMELETLMNQETAVPTGVPGVLFFKTNVMKKLGDTDANRNRLATLRQDLEKERLQVGRRQEDINIAENNYRSLMKIEGVSAILSGQAQVTIAANASNPLAQANAALTLARQNKDNLILSAAIQSGGIVGRMRPFGLPAIGFADPAAVAVAATTGDTAIRLAELGVHEAFNQTQSQTAQSLSNYRTSAAVSDFLEKRMSHAAEMAQLSGGFRNELAKLDTLMKTGPGGVPMLNPAAVAILSQEARAARQAEREYQDNRILTKVELTGEKEALLATGRFDQIGAEAITIRTRGIIKAAIQFGKGEQDIGKAIAENSMLELDNLKRSYLFSFRGEEFDPRRQSITNVRDVQDPNKVIAVIEKAKDDIIRGLTNGFKDALAGAVE